MLQRIVSGGQTGVDRAALDVAIAAGVEHGGWCPHGRRAEDGVIPPHYRLRETESSDYPVRTEQNVIDSDGTLLLYRNALAGGTKLTLKLARRHQRPALLQDLALSTDFADAAGWIRKQEIKVLNVAGPRESSSPGIAAEAISFLTRLLSALRGAEGGERLTGG